MLSVKGKPSLFVQDTPPEVGTEKSTVGDRFPTERLSAKDRVLRAKSFSTVYPTLFIRETIVSGGGVKLVPPEQTKVNGSILWFPMIKRDGESLISVKYLNKWVLPTERKGTGARSAPPRERNYEGYRGKEISFIGSLDDRFVSDDYPFFTYDVISTLIAWATMQTSVYLTSRIPVDLNIEISKRVSDDELKSIADSIIKYGQGAKLADIEKNVSNTYGKAKITEKVVGGKEGLGLSHLKNPLPPHPLSFRFGNLKIDATVIKQLDIRVKRYSDIGISAAEIKVTLIEILDLDDIYQVDDAKLRVIKSVNVTRARESFKGSEVDDLTPIWITTPWEVSAPRPIL